MHSRSAQYRGKPCTIVHQCMVSACGKQPRKYQFLTVAGIALHVTCARKSRHTEGHFHTLQFRSMFFTASSKNITSTSLTNHLKVAIVYLSLLANVQPWLSLGGKLTKFGGAIVKDCFNRHAHLKTGQV
jgi:hypothetical protein